MGCHPSHWRIHSFFKIVFEPPTSDKWLVEPKHQRADVSPEATMLKGFTRSSRTACEYDDGIYIGFTGGRYGDIITHFQVYVCIYIYITILYYTILYYIYIILSYIIHIITIVMIYNCSPYSLLYSYNLFPQYWIPHMEPPNWTPQTEQIHYETAVHLKGRWIGATILCGRRGFCKQICCCEQYTVIEYIYIIINIQIYMYSVQGRRILHTLEFPCSKSRPFQWHLELSCWS